MTAQPVAHHDTWEPLTAAYALHAIEPDEERRLLVHLDDCSRCAASLAGYALVAAQLGSLADTESDEPPTWQHVRGAVLLQPLPGVVVRDDHRLRRSRASRLLAAAAAVVALSGGAVAAWDISHVSVRHGPATVAAIAACESRAGCRIVRLHDPDGTNPAAVVVSADRVTLVPIAMTNASQGKTYALWQLPRDGGPILVTEFRQAAGPTASTPLPTDYADTAAFAISVESTQTTPSRPSHVLAIGSAT